MLRAVLERSDLRARQLGLLRSCRWEAVNAASKPIGLARLSLACDTALVRISQ